MVKYEELVCNCIYDACGIDVKDYNTNLFSDEVGLTAINLIYVLNAIEELTGTNIYKKMKNPKNTNMTVNYIVTLL